MIFKNKYNMSISDFEIMLDSKRYGLACRFWMPKFLAVRGYNKILRQWNDLVNSEEIDKILASDIFRLKLYSKSANHLRLLYFGLELMFKYGDMIPQKCKNVYVEEFKRLYRIEPTKKEHLKFIKINIDKLNTQLKQIEQDSKESDNKENASFSKTIFAVQSILGIDRMDRNLSIYSFSIFYKEAIEKAKILKRNKNKQHGRR